MYFWLAFGPKLSMVLSSPSPYPNCAGPLLQAVSLKLRAVQAVPWSVPLSRYFQFEFDATSVTGPAPVKVILIGGETPVAPALSKATAVTENVPRTELFHTNEYGLVLS